MTPSKCPPVEELARAVSRGELGALSEHVAVCDGCSSEWNGMRGLRALARDLPAPSVDPHAASVVRARVLEEASKERRRATRTRASMWAGFAIAAAAMLVLAVHGRMDSDLVGARRYHGTVTSVGNARFFLESARPNEVVRLEAGTIHVEVTPLGPGERFVVRAGDGEVEVRGTAFDVGMVEGQLTTVHVDHGRVEVRSADAKSTLLRAGDAWDRTAVVSSAVSSSTENLAIAPAVVPEAASEAPAAEARTRVLPARPSMSPVPATALPERGPRSEEPPPDPVPAVPAIPPYPSAVNTPSILPALPETSVRRVQAPAAAGVSDREEERRERRDDRRERNDQRRLR